MLIHKTNDCSSDFSAETNILFGASSQQSSYKNFKNESNNHDNHFEVEIKLQVPPLKNKSNSYNIGRMRN